jgi:hypothetical protein
MNKGQIVAALISAGTSAFTGVYALHQANKARNDREGLESDLNTLEENRQQIVNPYANVANQYANLGVATQAAEFQAEQADIALANTLDAVRQTGAGGATALAQAALQSKKGISAGLEKQELANEQLRARGAMEAQKLKAAGELDRTQAQIDQERMNQMQMRASAISSFTDIASNAASLAGVSSSSTNNVTSMGDFMSNTGSSYDEAANIAQAASTLGSVF